jgi:hypothetical protein
LELPAFSSVEIMRSRLLYAMSTAGKLLTFSLPFSLPFFVLQLIRLFALPLVVTMDADKVEGLSIAAAQPGRRG